MSQQNPHEASINFADTRRFNSGKKDKLRKSTQSADACGGDS